jgi:hypothetical protein
MRVTVAALPSLLILAACASYQDGRQSLTPGSDREPYWRRLEPPALILDGEKPIDVDMGHAAPAVFDFDGDGRKDLLVGQFQDGAGRIYLNLGSNAEPRFQGFTWLQTVDGRPVRVPFG